MTKTFSPSEAALSVFELAKRQPQFVLRFCIIYALTFIATYALMAATGVNKALVVYTGLTAGGRMPSPERIMEVLSPAGPGFLIFLIFALLVSAVTSAMGLRKAVLDEETGLFGLSFGKDEINLLVAMLIIVSGLFAVNMLVGLIGTIVTGGNFALMFLVVLVSIIAMCAVSIRFSQFGVLTIANQQIAVAQSWRETKGQSWRFIGAYLLWIVIATIIGLIFQSLGGIGAAAMGVKIGNGLPETFAIFFKPGWLFYTLVYGLASGFSNLGMICIGAYAWHQMRGDLPAPKSSL